MLIFYEGVEVLMRGTNPLKLPREGVEGMGCSATATQPILGGRMLSIHFIPHFSGAKVHILFGSSNSSTQLFENNLQVAKSHKFIICVRNYNLLT